MDTTLASRIFFILKRSDMSQTEFAKRMGISQQHISQICNAKRLPSDRTIMDICREFGCNEVWLRTGEGEPFIHESETEKIRAFAERTIKGTDHFRKTFASLLADLEEEDWAAIGEIYERLLRKRQKSDRE